MEKPTERTGEGTAEESSRPSRRPISSLGFLLRLALGSSLVVLALAFVRAVGRLPPGARGPAALAGPFVEALTAGAFAFLGSSIIAVLVFGLRQRS